MFTYLIKLCLEKKKEEMILNITYSETYLIIFMERSLP
jgi:hypothetical protein